MSEYKTFKYNVDGGLLMQVKIVEPIGAVDYGIECPNTSWDMLKNVLGHDSFMGRVHALVDLVRENDPNSYPNRILFDQESSNNYWSRTRPAPIFLPEE
jgi:hypothetical protein